MNRISIAGTTFQKPLPSSSTTILPVMVDLREGDWSELLASIDWFRSKPVVEPGSASSVRIYSNEPLHTAKEPSAAAAPNWLDLLPTSTNMSMTD
ncbi:hypothetical protein F442_01498 [Phytophthora nicotianae P10297]|uniref:Uncharacterized protein n=3 Tax=Phytophthora nicotianae TaxID=4792 RepID=W3A222_PHYNI|nr:hypothetical protein L916_01449 [Phytophthora nicotianae]ETO84558.1 hypothetical protein F444_01547 [Phytophthora nicotianae P1976]ETP53613.1 hypothetical protein F442_01498 [Phytophthora nicotianae P10297]